MCIKTLALSQRSKLSQIWYVRLLIPLLRGAMYWMTQSPVNISSSKARTVNLSSVAVGGGVVGCGWGYSFILKVGVVVKVERVPSDTDIAILAWSVGWKSKSFHCVCSVSVRVLARQVIPLSCDWKTL